MSESLAALPTPRRLRTTTKHRGAHSHTGDRIRGPENSVKLEHLELCPNFAFGFLCVLCGFLCVLCGKELLTAKIAKKSAKYAKTSEIRTHPWSPLKHCCSCYGILYRQGNLKTNHHHPTLQ